MEGADLAMKVPSTWLTLVLGLILLPSAFGLSLGVSEIYMKILVKTLEPSPEVKEGSQDATHGSVGVPFPPPPDRKERIC